ncbi:MAG: hypothetical protein CVU38_05350 [Chloroflexi bacterium HGW-Chloroflexi-1]|nr:MAG: hypothetical protein CVU38_05350 [Chloroflexi bacterium HGW-Chloroflexi-1]
MRIEDFPRPKDDNRRGVHWSASVYHPTGAALDFWISELQAMHIKWIKLMDDGGGSSLELCRRLLVADIMPIVRLYRLEPNPGHIGGREEAALRQLIDAGVRYFETNNEPDLSAEWKNGRMPADWLDVVIDNFIIDADKVIALGGLPALPAMGISSRFNPVQRVVDKGRADLFDKGAWVAIHNYTLNHPLDYPYDSVNQEGVPVSQEEYDRLGPWAWEGRPRELINQWRAADKNPGDTLVDDATCFLAFYLMDDMLFQTLGHTVPIISTEGGPVVGWKDDQRYPRLDPTTHAGWVVAINDFMQGGREIHGIRCPDSYFTMCYWLLGNYRLGFMAPGWESQSWYSDWWNTDFNLSGELPVVAAVKAMPSQVAPQIKQAVVAGQLLRADTDEPLPSLQVDLRAGDQVVASATSADDGAFRLERLTPGIYDLAVAPWGIVRRGVTAAPEPGLPVLIRLAGGRSSALTGKVLDYTDAPRAGIPVTLWRDGGPSRGASIGETLTDADGGFRFSGLPLGSYKLSIPGITVAGIALDGWATKNIKLTTGTPAGYRYAVTQRRLLPEAETAGRRLFYGTVSDIDGVPLNGIKLQMVWHSAAPGATFPTTTTGRDPIKPAGRYEFLNTPGVFSIRVIQGDWPSEVADDLDTANVPGRAGQPITYQVDFRLQTVASPTRLDGLVLSTAEGSAPGGQPGRKIKLTGVAGAQEMALGEDGSFAFPDLAPGSYRLELAGIGVIADEIKLEAGGLYRLIFPLRSRLSGRVLDPPDGLVAVLYAPLAWGWTRQAPLDPAGGFAFEGLPPGLYRLEVADQVLPDLELTGENSLQLAPIDLARGQRSVIRGRVADGAGKPQPDILMILRREGLIVTQAHTAADGTYRFANLPAGIYSLQAAGMGEVAGGIVLDGQREQVCDVLWGGSGPRGVIQGRVLANGVPQPDRLVLLLSQGQEVARTQTDSAGAFRFARLAGGVYTLAVGGPPGDGEPLVTDIRLAEDATLTQDINLPPGPRKPLAHYLLFGSPPEGGGGPAGDAEARLALALATRYLRRIGASGGFSLDEAAQAAEVIIVGDQMAATAEGTLRAAGCQVTRLSGDGYALAAAFAQRLSTMGEG